MLRARSLWVLAIGALTLSCLAAGGIRVLTATSRARTDLPGRQDDGILLPTGWVLHPAGRQIPSSDMPVAMALAPDGGHVLVSTAGYSPCQVMAIDTFYEQVNTTQTLDQSWVGMAFNSKGDTLYVAGGGRGLIWRFSYVARGGDLVRLDPIQIEGVTGRAAPYARARSREADTWIGGLACSPDDKTIYAVDAQQNQVYAIDPATGAIKAKAAAGDHPNTLVLTPDGRTLYVNNQGGGSVSVYDAPNLTKRTDIAVGKQPSALLLSPDAKRLYVANSGSNTVSVVDTASSAIRQTIRTSLFEKAPVGSTPNALALSPDAKRLFVTNADNNSVAVVDVSADDESRVVGFIPTGWYPTAVAVSKDGKKLFIGNGKGLGSRPSWPRTGGGVGLSIYNNGPTQSYGPKHDQVVSFDYICSLLKGTISVVDMPDDAQVARYTKQVIDGCPYRDELLLAAAEKPANCALPSRVGDKSPIQHVLYVIKENRTYDQVFGDIKEGNGDPNLVLFGENVTPNHHALAREFVLLDNLYCSGEVSEDGHQWSNAAMCTDWAQKAYTANYATPSRGDAPGGESVVASPAGYLWDLCANKGLSYRTYGEFTSFRSNAESEPVATSASPALRGHISVAWEQASRRGSKRRDYQRVDAFVEELKAAEKTGDWPNYMVMSLGEDHTSGLAAGTATPWAAVASNDLALGKIVDAVTHSKFWATTAIFVIEDDAQAGPDHVDAHRTVGLVVSPYTRRHAVDHTLYSTASFIRSMELLLGLPPMTQYDAGATPMFRSFTARANLKPYAALQARVDLAAVNPSRTAAAEESRHMDFSQYDRADPAELNRMLWTAIKGPKIPYPGTTSSTYALLTR